MVPLSNTRNTPLERLCPMAHEAATAVEKIANHVNGTRLWDRLMELALFGALPKGGVNRQALSDEEIAARACLVRWADTIGLEPRPIVRPICFSVIRAGNRICRRC